MALWKRVLLLLPFAVAARLTILVSLADTLHLRGQRIAGYGFAFGAPWGWMFERLPTLQSRFWQSIELYAVVLWFPAVMYCALFWCLLRTIEYATHIRRQ